MKKGISINEVKSLMYDNYIKNGYINGRKWYRESIINMAKMKYEEENSKEMSY